MSIQLKTSWVAGASMALLFCMACGDTSSSSETDLTSLTGVSRTIRFDGYVYVDAGASDEQASQAIQAQAISALGGFKNAHIGLNSRHMGAANPASFRRQALVVHGSERRVERVTYSYVTQAIVPRQLADHDSSTPFALLMDAMGDANRAIAHCTDGSPAAHEYPIWYEFNPALDSCDDDVRSEQAAIERAERGVAAGYVSPQEVGRYYLPTTFTLEGNQSNQNASYPEYDRLFSGGVNPNALVITLLNGILNHGAAETHDSGYREWMRELKNATAPRSYQLAEPRDLFSSLSLGTEELSFANLMNWETGNYPASVSTEAKSQFRTAITERLANHWVVLEAPVRVQLPGQAPRDFAIQIRSYYGQSLGPDQFAEALKNSDVFVYNGHAQLGMGPLDPNQLSAGALSNSYQLFFFDACLSYNYYEREFFGLKTGGSANLDLITNGLEAPSLGSGDALGRFVAELTSGRQPSYTRLLQVAQNTDRLRVVDGELDNAYSPTASPIVIQ